MGNVGHRLLKKLIRESILQEIGELPEVDYYNLAWQSRLEDARRRAEATRRGRRYKSFLDDAASFKDHLMMTNARDTLLDLELKDYESGSSNSTADAFVEDLRKYALDDNVIKPKDVEAALSAMSQPRGGRSRRR